MIKNRFVNRFLYPVYLVISVFLLFELALRIYNPFHFRVKGDQVVLDVNKTYRIDNARIPVLDRFVTHTKNSLGFRGPEKPDNASIYLTVITVGGSTTECQFINDGNTWSDILYDSLKKYDDKVWLNNAGMAGHSTFGHRALLTDHIIPLKPDFILFLVGVNDIHLQKANESDESNFTNRYKTVFTFLSKNSEVCNVIANLIRSHRAVKMNLTDKYLDLADEKSETLPQSERYIKKFVESDQPYRDSYAERLQQLITACTEANIKPVLITQPTLFGEGKDPVTNVDLETFKVKDNMNGRLWWSLLQSYNAVTKEVAARNKVNLIDLANLVPKSSAYFYDLIHFTNEGSRIVGNIVFNEFSKFLKGGQTL